VIYGDHGEHVFERQANMNTLKSRITLIAVAVLTCSLVATGIFQGYLTSHQAAHAASPASAKHMSLNCAVKTICADVENSEAIFGTYIGHDEPSVLFYSNKPGSGNQAQYVLTLPSDPSASNPTERGKSYNFELHPAFWFGMAMCDTQSFPEQLKNCPADSDNNISDPNVTPKHVGEAFMEMQFYPPGWVEWPAGNSCDPTKWCAALNIDSLSENPVTGQTLNPTCASTTGLEYVNFAFITKSGKPQPNSPPNPVQSTINTFTPNPSYDLFMNSGDKIVVNMHDTDHGLLITLNDKTSGQSGSMKASAANGFGMVKWAPSGTSCTDIPYDFHPMYSTSSESTRVTWAAHSYNVAFADEIGHFDFCNGSNAITPTGACPTGNTEGMKGDYEPTDGDDTYCFPASSSSLVQVAGCQGTNAGFDGMPYQRVWPDGDYNLHPTPITFSGPLTGSDYNINYQRIAFEADLPIIENPNVCNIVTGFGCTLIPQDDEGQAAAFYPFYSTSLGPVGCVWRLGNHMKGSTNDFGQNNQYGQLLALSYTALGGGPQTLYTNFRQILSYNPCTTKES
jgi:hypothetical protein